MGSEKVQICVTSFMNGPLVVFQLVLKRVHYSANKQDESSLAIPNEVHEGSGTDKFFDRDDID